MSFKSTNDQSQALANPLEVTPSIESAEKLNHEYSPFQTSLLGKAISIKGDILAKEDMLINGQVNGLIALKQHKLEIGLTARLQANVFAKTVIVTGEIIGDIYASQQVTVANSGRVIGNIYAADINMEDGATIKGSINMDMQEFPSEHFGTTEEQEVEVEEKSSSFGFLFKKTRGNADGSHFESSHSENSIQSSASNFSSPDIHSLPACAELSLIGKSISIKGKVEAEEDIMLQGELEGAIYLKNNNLELGPHAKVVGNIFVNSLLAYGDIKGDVYASEQVGLKKPAHVFGTINSPRIRIESGAILMGNIEMEPQNLEEIYNNVAAPSSEKMSRAKKRQLESTTIARTNTVTQINDEQAHSTEPKRVPWPE